MTLSLKSCCKTAGMVPPPAGGCIDWQSRCGLGTGFRGSQGIPGPRSKTCVFSGFIGLASAEVGLDQYIKIHQVTQRSEKDEMCANI